MMTPARCARITGNTCLQGHDGAAQIDGGDAVKCGFSEIGEHRVAAGKADADIVVKDIDPAPTLLCGFDHRRKRCLFGHIRFESSAFSGRLPGHHDRFLDRSEILVDGQKLGAFLGEAQNRSAAVAHALARRLTGTHDDRDLVLETHANLD
jgi:hypothetical protein